jgi:hypothetical protein
MGIGATFSGDAGEITGDCGGDIHAVGCRSREVTERVGATSEIVEYFFCMNTGAEAVRVMVSRTATAMS